MISRRLFRRTILRVLGDLSRKVDVIMTNQEKINDLAARFGETLDGVRQDVVSLKAQIQAGVPAELLDFSPLESKLADAQGLDSETPEAPPAG